MRSHSVLAPSVKALALAVKASLVVACGSPSSVSQRETLTQLSKLLPSPVLAPLGGKKLTASRGASVVTSGAAGSSSIKGKARSSQVVMEPATTGSTFG